MTASAAITAAAAMRAPAAAADLSFMVNLIINEIPHGQTHAAKYNNCRNYCCHDIIPFHTQSISGYTWQISLYSVLLPFPILLLYPIFFFCTSPKILRSYLTAHIFSIPISADQHIEETNQGNNCNHNSNRMGIP